MTLGPHVSRNWEAATASAVGPGAGARGAGGGDGPRLASHTAVALGSVSSGKLLRSLLVGALCSQKGPGPDLGGPSSLYPTPLLVPGAGHEGEACVWEQMWGQQREWLVVACCCFFFNETVS